jgi:trans-aconitate methyltransferase
VGQIPGALDRQVEPLGLAAMTTLQPKEGEHILDIGCGCGCGQTSVDLASRVGATGSVLGVDISQPMLESRGGGHCRPVICTLLSSNSTLNRANSGTSDLMRSFRASA